MVFSRISLLILGAVALQAAAAAEGQEERNGLLYPHYGSYPVNGAAYPVNGVYPVNPRFPVLSNMAAALNPLHVLPQVASALNPVNIASNIVNNVPFVANKVNKQKLPPQTTTMYIQVRKVFYLVSGVESYFRWYL